MASLAFEVNNTPPGVKAPPVSGTPPPVLVLKMFQRPPSVSFGTIKLGFSKTLLLTLSNPAAEPIEVFVDKVPTSVGFSVDTERIHIPEYMESTLRVHWTPVEAGNVRGVLSLHTSAGLRSQAILLGTGKSPAVQKRKVAGRGGPASRGRSTQPLRTQDANRPPVQPVRSAGRRQKPPTAENSEPRGLVVGGSSPLNSTHRLEAGADCTGLLANLRTPPDFPVSFIRPDDVDCTPRRQTFLVGNQPPETPIRRQTFYHVGSPQEAVGMAVLETPHELKRISARIKQETSLPPPRPVAGSAKLNVTTTISSASQSVAPHSVNVKTEWPTPILTRYQPFVAPSAAHHAVKQVTNDHHTYCDAMPTPQLFPRATKTEPISPPDVVRNAGESAVRSESGAGENSDDSMPSTDAVAGWPVGGECRTPQLFSRQTAPQNERETRINSSDGNSPEFRPAYRLVEESVTEEEMVIRHVVLPLGPRDRQERCIFPIQCSAPAADMNAMNGPGFLSRPMNDNETTTGDSGPLDQDTVISGIRSLTLTRSEEGNASIFDQLSTVATHPVDTSTPFPVNTTYSSGGIGNVEPLTEFISLPRIVVEAPSGSSDWLDHAAPIHSGSEPGHRVTTPPNRCGSLDENIDSAVAVTSEMASTSTKPPSGLLFVPFDNVRIPRKRSAAVSCRRSIKPAASPVTHRRVRPDLPPSDRKSSAAALTKPLRLTVPVTPGRNRARQRTSDGPVARGGVRRGGAVTSAAVVAGTLHRPPPGTARGAASLRTARGTTASAFRAQRQSSLRLRTTRSAPVCTVSEGNPFVTRNSCYDKDWAEKRGRGFSAWLNYVLTPSEEFVSKVVETRVDAAHVFMSIEKSHVPPAPSKEALSLRSYMAVRRLNRLRRTAFQLYESEAVRTAVNNVDKAVEKGGLLVRKDKALHADMGLKRLVMTWLLNYHPLWLRLGLETVYGVIIHTRGTDDIQTLAKFIADRLLWDANIASQYRHRTVPHLYSPDFDPVMKRFSLKKFVVLVFFLDVAKRARVIKHDPCLFNKHAPIKASRDLLVEFARELLSGEGDITKHLAYLGMSVSHSQTLLEEFNYSINNIAVDLRCGIRLTRVVETLSEGVDLSGQLRVPALDRHQKIHNLRVAISGSGLQEDPVALAKRLVDGHQEATLQFIWKLILKYQVLPNVDKEVLRKETTVLEKSLETNCLLGNQSAVQGKKLMASPLCVSSDNLECPPAAVGTIEHLLRWCRLVCAHYGVSVSNMSSSFRDGRALCVLVHHYQPSLLPLTSIRWQTTETEVVSQLLDSDSELDDDVFSYPGHLQDPARLKELKHNEAANINLALNAMTELGGVAVVHVAQDMGPPDCQLMALQLQLLCVRLLQLGAEHTAARTLQLWWRRMAHSARLRQQVRRN